MHLQTHSITFSNCIAHVAHVWPPIASDHSQQFDLPWAWLVLATVPGNPATVQVGTGTVALVLFWNRDGFELPNDQRFQTPTTPSTTVLLPGLHSAEPHFCELRSLALIKYSSSDRITIQYICKWCPFAYSFTPYSPIRDQINIIWVTVI